MVPCDPPAHGGDMIMAAGIQEPQAPDGSRPAIRLGREIAGLIMTQGACHELPVDVAWFQVATYPMTT